MSDIVERVARAIAFRHFMGKQHYGYCSPEKRAEYSANQYWRNYIEYARAAIEAMREPNDAMCDAADWQQQSEVNQYHRAIDAALGKIDA